MRRETTFSEMPIDAQFWWGHGYDPRHSMPACVKCAHNKYRNVGWDETYFPIRKPEVTWLDAPDEPQPMTSEEIEREQCCRDMCDECRKAEVPAHRTTFLNTGTGSGWRHGHAWCEAAPIRERVYLAEHPEAPREIPWTAPDVEEEPRNNFHNM